MPRTPAHARARTRTHARAHAALRGTAWHCVALRRSEQGICVLKFRARGCRAVCCRPGWSEILRGRAWAIAREGAEGGQVPEGIWVMWVSIAPIRRSIRYRLVVRRWRSRRPPHCFTHNLSQRMCLWMCVCDVCARVCVCARACACGVGLAPLAVVGGALSHLSDSVCVTRCRHVGCT